MSYYFKKLTSLLLIFYLILLSSLFVTEQVTANNHLYHYTNKQYLSSNTSSPTYWPTYGWRNSTPEAEGMDTTILNDMLDYIDEQEYPIDSVFIVKNGYLVFEDYPTGIYNADRMHEMHSVTKSFTSTLIGIALQQGLIETVDEFLLDFFPEYTPQNPDPRKNQITIEHLLTMTAGLEWDENNVNYTDPNLNDIGGIFYSNDGVQFVLDKPMIHDPGTHWLYSGGVSLLLGAIIQQVSNYTTNAFAREFLFDPLGFGRILWATVPGGWYNTFGGQFKINPKDMAKLGFLYLHNGMWNGTQILSEDYVHNATQQYFTDIYFGLDYAAYGWHWWTLRDMKSFAALGRAGQKIIVSREHNLITVFTASIPDLEYDPEFDLYFSYILESIKTTESNPFESSTVIFGIVSCLIATPLVVYVIYYFKRTKHTTSS